MFGCLIDVVLGSDRLGTDLSECVCHISRCPTYIQYDRTVKLTELCDIGNCVIGQKAIEGGRVSSLMSKCSEQFN